MGKKPHSENPLLKQVLTYYRRGWSIIPIGLNKKAAVQWKKYQKTRPDENQLRKWFANGKFKSFAVICGAVSGGLAVLDLDSQKRCDWWRREHPDLADTLPNSETSKGQHFFFRSEPFRKQNGDEVDLLCEGSYAILPPSPEKEWIRPLDGELPLLDPFKWGLEQFGITAPQKERQFTEEPEETEDIEDIEAIRVRVVVYNKLNKELKKKVKLAISCTLPDKKGYRNFLIFQFCRWLKGISEFAKLSAKSVKSLCREWHRRALPKIGTKPFDETWADFAYGWKRVKYPKGEGMLKLAIQKAMEATTHLDAEKEYESEEAQLLVRVCYELQRLQGTEPFWLSCYSAALILGISHTEANKKIQMLVADDVLRLVEKNTARRATRYRFIGN